MCRLKYLTLLFAYLLSTSSYAQLHWIGDATFFQAPVSTLYKMCDWDRPLVLAAGNIHSQPSQELLSSHLLQKLNRDHGLGDSKTIYSSGDLRIAFLNIQVIDGEEAPKNEGFPIISIKESDSALNMPGWDFIYSISATGLFLVTADHLVYPLKSRYADDLFTEARTLQTRVKPDERPDVRILDVRPNEDGNALSVTIQNFSNQAAADVDISISIDHEVRFRKSCSQSILPLDILTIQLPVEKVENKLLEVAAETKHDSNPLNNIWMGRIVPATIGAIAGTSRH